MLQKISQMRQARSSKVFLLILPKYLISIFAIITTLAAFIPLNPGMPQSGLDASAMFSMNEAVAQNLKIGKDIIFTFGPYASILSQSYHPATDYLMVFGGYHTILWWFPFLERYLYTRTESLSW